MRPQAISKKSGILTLMTSTVMGQLITVVGSPVLTRLFSPVDLGLQAAFVTFVSVLWVAACGRYEVAIVLPEQDGDAAQLVALSWLVSLLLSGLLAVPALCFPQHIANLLGAPSLARWLWLAPISLFLAGVFQAANYWLTRTGQFKVVASAQLGNSLSSTACQIALGASTSLGALGLMLGTLLGQAVSVVVSIRTTLRNSASRLSVPDPVRLRHLAKAYKNFPLLNMWPSLLNVAAVSIPLLFVARGYGPAAAGYFALATRILRMPTAVIGSSIYQVILADFSRIKEDRPALQRSAISVFVPLLSSSIALVLVLQLAPQVFPSLFGANWSAAGEYVKILAVSTGVRLIASPMSAVFIVFERQAFLSVWQHAYLAATVVGLWVGIHHLNLPHLLYLMVAIDVVMYGAYLACSLYLAGIRPLRKQIARNTP